MRKIYACAVWTHKIQEKQAEMYDLTQKILTIIELIISTLIGTGFVAVCFKQESWIAIIGAVFSVISIFVKEWMKVAKYEEKKKVHKQIAIEWLSLRDNCETFIADMNMGIFTVEELLEKRKEFLAIKEDLCKRTPDASNRAVKRADKCLKKREDNTYTDQEINNWLPKILKK